MCEGVKETLSINDIVFNKYNNLLNPNDKYFENHII
jgi:hypothetical protein